MDKETKQIIENAIKNPEFIKGLVETVDWFDVIVKTYRTENVILLRAIREMLERRIIELNIMFWFRRIERVENNIMGKILNEGN